jgi:hypothetical protein
LYTAYGVGDNGGSTILGYDLWRDDGNNNGNFFSLYKS